jgi:hypothetical protein
MLTLPASLGCVTMTQPWYRIHQLRYGAVFFGTSKLYRFDDPAQTYGVLYVAENVRGAIVETLYPKAMRRRGESMRILSESFVNERALAPVFFERPLRLVDLTSRLARFGTTASRATSPSRTTTQGWSRQLYEHPDQPDGILFCSQYDLTQRCAAVFDRAAAAANGSFPLSAPAVLPFLVEARDLYGFRIDPTVPPRL